MFTEKYDEEIFDNTAEAAAIVWWLVNLLGGEVSFSTNPEFWDENIPSDCILVLSKKDDKLVLRAERLDSADED